MVIHIFTTGGSIDKIYSTQKSTFVVGEPAIEQLLLQGNVSCGFQIEPLFRKDSLEITAGDRQVLHERVRSSPHRHILITHGTDTMIETARTLNNIPDKVIVLTGAMQPAGFVASDALFNIGCAIAALQTLPVGVYIAMNGCIFNPNHVRKNTKLDRFEAI